MKKRFHKTLILAFLKGKCATIRYTFPTIFPFLEHCDEYDATNQPKVGYFLGQEAHIFIPHEKLLLFWRDNGNFFPYQKMWGLLCSGS